MDNISTTNTAATTIQKICRGRIIRNSNFQDFITYQERKLEPITCPITLNNVSIPSAIITNCGHGFCRQSLETWITLNTNCPLCRSNIYPIRSLRRPPQQSVVTYKNLDGSIEKQEGLWGPKDPANPQGDWCLTGQGTITRTIPNGPIIKREGLWGPKDPANPQGDWCLTGQGKKTVTYSDGSIVEHEGQWAPKDPSNL